MNKKTDKQAPPKSIYAKNVTDDGEEPYLVADDDLGTFDDGDLVGVYVLTAVGKVNVRRELI